MSKKYLTYNGVTKTMSEWARELKMSRQTLHERLSNGWTVERALSGMKAYDAGFKAGYEQALKDKQL